MKHISVILISTLFGSLFGCQSSPSVYNIKAQCVALYLDAIEAENSEDRNKNISALSDYLVGIEYAFWRHFAEFDKLAGGEKSRALLKNLISSHGVSVIVVSHMGKTVISDEELKRILQENPRTIHFNTWYQVPINWERVWWTRSITRHSE